MADFDYGGKWRDHDMAGEISLSNNSMVKVHDITDGLPEFMKQADTLFIDPPCSPGNLKSFHTKAGNMLPYTFSDFESALWRCIREINPRHLFMELFKSNIYWVDTFLKNLYVNTVVYESCYYNKKSNKCWVFHASNEKLSEYNMCGMDEGKIIAWVCKNHEYQCVGDLCMGRGLVGKHAYLNGKQFVGTELNHKRLAVLVDYIRKAEKLKGKRYV